MASVRQENVQVNVEINGKRAGGTIAELEKNLKAVKRELRHLPDGSEEFVKKSKEFDKINADLRKMKGEAYGVGKAMESGRKGMGLLSKGAGTLKTAFQGAMAALLPLLAFQQVWEFLKGSKEAFDTQDKAVKQLEATLTSTGGAAGRTKEEIMGLASELQGKTLFGDEATIGAAALLGTFTNIRTEIFDRTLPAIQDVATKMAGDGPADLKGATIQLGKALNDPIKGVSALTEVGVTFTDQQKAQIKVMQEAGDVAGAQAIVLSELEKEFGGSAEAARKAGSGGFTAFMNTVGDLRELLGEKISNALNAVGNFLGDVIVKADPLVVVFREVWTEASNLFSELSRLITGLFGFSQEGSAAEATVNALTAVFKIILMPIKVVLQVINAITSGFIQLYNSSEVLRGTLGGLGAVISKVFQGIQETAMNTLGGVADLLVGIFTLDPDKIKSGLDKSFNALSGSVTDVGKGLAVAFAEGYGKGASNFIPENAEEETEIQLEAVNRVIENSGEEALALTKEQLDKLKKAREQYEKDQLTAAKAIEDLRIALIKDSFEREIAQLELNTKRKIEALVGTPEQIAEQQALIEEQLLRGIAETREKQAEAEKEARLKTYEERLEEEAEREEMDMLRLEEKFLLGLETEQQRNEAAYELERAALEARLEMIKGFHGEESLEYARAKNQILALDKEHQDQVIENEKRTADLKKAVQTEGFNTAQSFVQLAIDLMGQDEEARKKNAKKIKAFQIAEISIGLIKEVQAIWAGAAQLGPIAGPILGAVQTGIALVRGGMAIGKVNSQKFALGGLLKSVKKYAQGGIVKGPSHANGGVPFYNPNSGTIDEMEGDEIILTGGVSRDPRLKAVASMINRAAGGRMFAAGGPVNPYRVAAEAAVNGGATAQAMDQAVGQSAQQANPASDMLLTEVRGLRSDVQNMNTRLKAYIVYSEFEDTQQEVAEVRNDASIQA